MRFSNDAQRVTQNSGFAFEVRSHDPDLRASFELSGRGQLADEIDEITGSIDPTCHSSFSIGASVTASAAKTGSLTVASYGNLPYIYEMRSSAKETKSERIELRVTPSAKAIIARASAVAGLTAGDMAAEAARRILEEREMLTLRDADRDALFAALERAPQAPPRLVAALRRHRAAVR